MRTEKQKWLAYAIIGTFVIGLTGCVDPYPPQRAQYREGAGPYSYYDYPNNYEYYDDHGNRLRGGYSDDENLRYDAKQRDSWHSDDHNYHNRDDFDHWDY